MHENGRRVQAEHLEHVMTLVKVDGREKQFVGVRLRIPVAVGRDRELVGRMATDDALSGRRHGSKHDNHRVVSGTGFDEILELLRIELEHRALVVHVKQLLHLLVERGRLKSKSIR